MEIAKLWRWWPQLDVWQVSAEMRQALREATFWEFIAWWVCQDKLQTNMLRFYRLLGVWGWPHFKRYFPEMCAHPLRHPIGFAVWSISAGTAMSLGYELVLQVIRLLR